MSLPAYKQAILDWLTLSLPTLTGVLLAPVKDAAGRSAERWTRPYATVKVLTNKGDGTPHQRTTDTPAADPNKFVHIMTQQRSGTLSVSIYADDHEELAELLDMSTYDPNVVETTEADELAIRSSIAGSKNSTASRSVSFETFSVIDFRFGYRVTKTTSVYAIETVEISGNL